MPEMPFEPGKSGNPAGKLKGTRNKTTLAVEALFDGESETITRKAIELAKDGDLAALRLCLDRIAPPRKCVPTIENAIRMQCQKCLLNPERAAIPQENSRARAIRQRWQLRLYSTAAAADIV
jgi:hypothetical protein